MLPTTSSTCQPHEVLIAPQTMRRTSKILTSPVATSTKACAIGGFRLNALRPPLDTWLFAGAVRRAPTRRLRSRCSDEVRSPPNLVPWGGRFRESSEGPGTEDETLPFCLRLSGGP